MRPENFNPLFDLFCERYPKAFSREPLEIRPLKHDILEDIVLECGESMRRPAHAMLSDYQRWHGYLFAVAFGKRRRDLHGNKAGKVTLEERLQAVRILEHAGLWTERQQAHFDYRARQAGLVPSPETPEPPLPPPAL